MNTGRATREKNIGNDFYKAQLYEEALYHYNKSIEYNQDDIRLYLNKAIIYLDTHDYDECIRLCEIAISVGRANKAENKFIAKAYHRLATAFMKKQDFVTAEFFFKISFDIDKSPETLKKRVELETIRRKRESLSNRVEAEKAERIKNYKQAIKLFTKAIELDPKNARLYYERAHVYQKLNLPVSIYKDSNMCIELDPTFTPAYFLRGNALLNFGQFKSSLCLAGVEDLNHFSNLTGIEFTYNYSDDDKNMVTGVEFDVKSEFCKGEDSEGTWDAEQEMNMRGFLQRYEN